MRATVPTRPSDQSPTSSRDDDCIKRSKNSTRVAATVRCTRRKKVRMEGIKERGNKGRMSGKKSGILRGAELTSYRHVLSRETRLAKCASGLGTIQRILNLELAQGF